MYASIDHTTTKGPSRTRATADDDCDYATVFVPAPPQPERLSQCSSKDECADDYVLMGAERCRVEVLHKWRDSFSTMEGKGMAAKKNSKHKSQNMAPPIPKVSPAENPPGADSTSHF
ncbi:hypothetical protein F7725_002001 [Dissostichus mawsoni]|uniref:Uncharacterized protein n=1 Tax=Dissostichus mawsoni TaxID=36200 RepID=A0A7J5Y162_DISMA|nr:hypothetical protein F7725_002001 [Dissostichus mawsoni]